MVRLSSAVNGWALAATVVLAIVLVAPAHVGAQGQESYDEPQSQGSATERVGVPKYPIGAAIDVHLRNKETITGRVEKYASDGIWVQAQGNDSRSHRKIFYFEMQSVSAARSGQAGKARFSVDFLMGRTGATVRVYRPSDASH
jgi:hypothetical protein